MARKTHVIQTPGNTPYPNAVVVVHSATEQKYMGEADDVGHLALVRWVAAYGVVIGRKIDWRNWQEGKDAEQWWQWLVNHAIQGSLTWLVSVSAREQAAALDLWGELAANRMTVFGFDPWKHDRVKDETKRADNGYIVLEGPPTVICFKGTKCSRSYTWLDVANWGCRDIRAVAITNDSKMPSETLFPDEPWTDKLTLRTQCNAVQTFVEHYFDCIGEHDLGGPQHTAASQAQAGYRGHYMRHAITVHDNESILRLERQALYGGRCEAAYIGSIRAYEESNTLYKRQNDPTTVIYGAGTIYHLDVNSLYPSVAVDAMLPTKLVAVTGSMPLKTAITAAENCSIVATVNVTTDKPTLPLSWEKKCIWPIGNFTTTVCGPELLLAVESGAKVAVLRSAVYESRPIYTQWVKRLYELRCKYSDLGQHVYAQVIKGILNASFGKWAQLSRRWEPVDDYIPPAPYTQWYGERLANDQRQQWRSLAWEVSKLVVQGETNESFPAITAYINSLGRVRLWELLETAGLHNVYYYDTDSVWCNATGYEALVKEEWVHPKALGLLKIKSAHNSLDVLGRQAYIADGKLTLSGVAGKLVKAMDATATTLKAPPLQHYLLQSKAPGLDRHLASVRLRRHYEHGHVTDSGRVTPLEFKGD